MGKKSGNHTTRNKTIGIRCIGYGPEGGRRRYVKGHTAVRLVHSQDVHQVKRCEACQKEFHRLRAVEYRKADAERTRIKQLKLDGTRAKATLKEFGDKLTPRQIAELTQAVKLAKG